MHGKTLSLFITKYTLIYTPSDSYIDEYQMSITNIPAVTILVDCYGKLRKCTCTTDISIEYGICTYDSVQIDFNLSEEIKQKYKRKK